MLTNYIKIALRSIQRQKGYAVINILGLAVGLTVSLLIFLWIQDERGIDQFHKDGDRIFRILTNIDTGNGGMMTWETAPYPLIDHLRENYPEVEDVAAYDRTNKMQFELGEQVFLEDGIYATAGFFRILNFPLVEGVPSSVFEQPKAVVISDRLAEKFFGPNWEGQAVGQTVSINGDKTYQVTGVFEPLANHSSLEFDFVLDQDALHHDDANGFPWGNFDSRILVKAQSGVSQTALAAKVKDIIREQNEYGDGVDLIVQPFGRMYLHGKFENGKEAGGRIEYVRLFGLAAVVLLIIACINFMNLSTARASKRAREVGVRKTIGADRRSLVLQFLVESALITGIGFVVAVALSRLLLPYFHEITGKQLVMDWTDPAFWWLLLGTAGLTALLAGSYPAFFLSSFSITNVLKGQLTSNLKSGSLRKGLVVFQFVLSALLVVGALVVQDQVDFIKNKQLGLNKENVLYFRTPPGAAEQQDAFKNELTQLPGVEAVTYSSSNPLSVNSQTGDPIWEGMAEGEGLLFHVLRTDEDFLETLKIPLRSGETFTKALLGDTVAYLINKTAAKAMQLEDPVGKNLAFWGVGGPIMGVVEDFHISSLHEAIGPLIIAYLPEMTNLTMLRIDPDRTEALIPALKSKFERFAQGYPFRYDFMDERYWQVYETEQRTSTLAGWFAMLALFVSCLGLLGLSAFIAEQKTKEIGIRKVLGASVSNIVQLLSREFIQLVGISLLIALPLGWYFMHNWLQDFAYRTDLSWWIFALAGGLAIVVALLTVSFHSLRAALHNPVDSLRSE